MTGPFSWQLNGNRRLGVKLVTHHTDTFTMLRARLAGVVVFCMALSAARLFAQDSTRGPREGLWEAKRRFGPDVRGMLTVAREGNIWRAEIYGVQAQFQPHGDTVAFDLP